MFITMVTSNILRNLAGTGGGGEGGLWKLDQLSMHDERVAWGLNWLFRWKHRSRMGSQEALAVVTAAVVTAAAGGFM